jgi:hypothetical protein
MDLNNKQLLTLQKTAYILGVKYARTAEMVRTGTLPDKCVVRLGRQIRIDPDALAAFIGGGGKPLAGDWRREARG